MGTFTLSWVAAGVIIAFVSFAGGALVKWIISLNGDLKHEQKGLKQMIVALQHFRTADIERIAKLEANYTSLKDASVAITAKCDAILLKLGTG